MSSEKTNSRIVDERRRLGRLHIAKFDLNQAYSFAEILLERVLEEQRQDQDAPDDSGDLFKRRNLHIAIELAMIVAYCRPFLQSHGGKKGKTAFQISDRFVRVFDEQEKAVHSNIIKRRSSEVAHSDGDSYSLSLHRFNYKKDGFKWHPLIRNPFPLVDLVAVESLLSMIPKLLKEINQSIADLESRIEPDKATIYFW